MDIRLPRIPHPPRMGIKCLSKVAVTVFTLLTGQGVQLEDEKLFIVDLVTLGAFVPTVRADCSGNKCSYLYKLPLQPPADPEYLAIRMVKGKI